MRDGQELPAGPQSPARCPRRGADPGDGRPYFERGIVSLRVPFRRLPRPHQSPHTAAPSRGDDIILTHDAPGQWEEWGEQAPSLQGEVWRRITDTRRRSEQGFCWARGAG